MTLDNDFATQRRHGYFDQILSCILVDWESLADAVQVGESSGRSHLETVCDADGVDALVE